MTVTQLCQQKFEQEGAADIVDQYAAIFDPPTFEGRAVARTTDLHANDAAAEHLEQGFTINRVIAQIGDDHTIAVVVLIDLRQLIRQLAAVNSKWKLAEFLNQQLLAEKRRQ